MRQDHPQITGIFREHPIDRSALWTDAHFVVCLLALALRTSATNFEQCIADIRSGAWGITGGTDSHGHPVSNISEANAITYALCVRACGTSPEPFDWPAFYQQFSSWLLPYFALLSQLPFGAESRLSNLSSVLLTVGSPTLAAYSLALTALNKRWVTRRFRTFSYPNAKHAAAILGDLQGVPVRIAYEDGLFPSLVVLHQNDEWWRELSMGLKHSSPWSIAAVTSMGWVVVAYILTIIDSFTPIQPDVSPPFRPLGILNLFGKGVGFVWLWLLPIVYGWIQVSPICDTDRLRRLFNHADLYTYIATLGSAEVVKATSTSSLRGLTIESSSRHAGEPYADIALADSQLCAPVFNYARVFSWSATVEDIAAAFASASWKARARIPVSGDVSWVPSGATPHPSNRIGSLQEVLQYCGSPLSDARTRTSLKVYERVVVASLAALSLQWGTTGAAILVVYFAPTVGLGCESGAFLVYGVISTVVWMLMLSSSILAHHAHPRSHRADLRGVDGATHVASTLAVTLRRMGKILASLNTAWIIAANIAQFSNFFNRCWCNSCALSLGSRAFNVIHATASDIAGMKSGWIGGIVLATGCALSFVSFIHILLDPMMSD
ncbi:hypothetical protein L226DRAFT_457633 [Lentinus tigrinus ALCF2SS1-7]|uniref:uncharacterized protein n=1 Tax=Lentinus tigrinus ALCF2SS1-7 TaxID=1328758 RepID=UPI001165D62B|nr:hypothetical protein L226DRAFT_457633 [Lentinus tigrinus ALCF2SS1-7]